MTPDLTSRSELSTQAARRQVLAVAAGLATAAAGWMLLRLVPQLPLEFFAQASARLAGLFAGAHVERIDTGWLLAGTGRPVVVTAACSATDFFVIVATLLAWQWVRQGRSPVRAVPAALGAALPLAVGVNALRVVVVAQAHRWLIPALPAVYGPYLHMLTGVAVFLPALIALNLLLESHGRPRSRLLRVTEA